MSSFKTFIEADEKLDGTYCAAKYSALTTAALLNWCLYNGIPNPIAEDKMHSTVIYSKRKIPEHKHLSMSAEQLKDHAYMPLGLDVFGKDKRILVLKLTSPELTAMHYHMREAGGTHDFPTYDPHITLSYDLGDYDISELEMPPFAVNPIAVYTEPLSGDWA